MVLAAAPQVPLPRRQLPVALAALVVTQMIGWGSTFHVPAVLWSRISAGTGLSREVVYGGLTLMLVVSAVTARTAGRLLERDGARRWMTVGSCLIALALTTLALARGPVLFVLSWIVFGLAMPLALNQGSSTALVQISPARARRAIALLLLLTGFSSTIAWPALIWLDGHLGWRQTLLAVAAVHLLVCAPLHAFALPKGRAPPEPAPESDRPEAADAVAARPVRSIYLLAAMTFSLSGVLTWGLPLHMIGILEDYGHSETEAVAMGALIGPGQVLARALEMLGGERLGILTLGVGAAAAMVAALAALLAWGATPAGAILFAIGYGLSGGISSIVRAVAPLRLFGAAAYATMIGRLGAWQNAAFATAPLGFAVVLEQFGAPALATVALAMAAVALATMSMLLVRARAAHTD